MNIRNWLVHLYPGAWRDRYGEEFDLLLEECLHSPIDVLDVFLGALDAHLGFHYENSWRLINMVNKLRTAVLLVFAGFIGFVIGGFSLIGLADDSPMAALMKTDTSLSTTMKIVQAGSVIAFLAVVIGGLPIAWTVIRRALTSSHRDFRLLLVPVFSFLALVLYAAFMVSVGRGLLQIPGVITSVSPGNFPLGNRLMIAGMMLVFVLGAIASTVAVWKVISKNEAEESSLKFFGREISIKLYEYAYVPAVIATLAMVVMLAATVAWGWLANSAMPQVFAGNWGLLLTNTTGSFAVTVSIMAASTAVALLGILRGRPARNVA